MKAKAKEKDESGGNIKGGSNIEGGGNIKGGGNVGKGGAKYAQRQCCLCIPVM